MSKNNFLIYIKSHVLELITFFIYVFAIITLTKYHEPWFDEFQAWGISKDSIYNILFVIPHYEGHPPLWHLILKCFSYFNVPAEMGIRIPNIIFISAAMWLLIFKAPFKRCYRIIFPFTYFLFYQYALVNRPYSIFCFAAFLSAYFYKTRNEYPLRFIFSLCLLCLSSAYGIAVSAGIVLAWVVEIIKEKGIKSFFREIIEDNRTKSMFIVFFLSLLLAIEIFPAKNNYETNQVLATDYIVKFLYAFFGLSSDSFITNVLSSAKTPVYKYDFADLLHLYNIKVFDKIIWEFWVSVVFGVLISTILFKTFKKLKGLMIYFMSVYSFLFVAFALYILQHHIGIYIILLIFSFWAALSAADIEYNPPKIVKYLFNLIILVQLFWSFMAITNDILYNYSFGREIAQYINETKLDNKKMYSAWLTKNLLYDKNVKKNFFSAKNREIVSFELEEHNMQVIPVSLNQYFNKNLFCNFNMDTPDKQYVILKKLTKDEEEEYKNSFLKCGLPDVIIGKNETNNLPDKYTPVKIFEYGAMWKNTRIINKIPLYIRNDLIDETSKKD